MSDTPETDIEKRMAYSQEVIVPLEFAQRLERERNQLQIQLDSSRIQVSILAERHNEMLRERNRWREYAEKLAEARPNLVRIDS
jgi:hypothetical protein